MTTHDSSPMRGADPTRSPYPEPYRSHPHLVQSGWDSDGQDTSASVELPAVLPKPPRKRKEKEYTPRASATAVNPQSIYTGNKVRHIKKDDGDPLWRKDIQYDFLKLVFEDDRAVFTNSYEPDNIKKQTFANLYIDTMARSSKTSKILRDKLLTEHEPAKNMAMVCLLVNLGRMNTTLNCKSCHSFNFKAF
jgi:Ino eighty subunit 1